jgi:DNA polymerase-3 subunit gamma/tau
MIEKESQLAISMRPKSLDEMIGVDKLVKRLRVRMESGRIPKAFMFSGQTGCGKTTLAQIVALGLQCYHHKKFGEYCKRCQRHKKEFDIRELDMPDISAKELAEILDGSNYHPKPGSRYKVYVLDEAHAMSKPAQTKLLNFTENCPKTTKFILATTQPDSILRTLRRRHKIYPVPDLEIEDVRKLVRRGLKKIHSELDSSELAEKLLEKSINSPGLILNAVENYVDGMTADEASEVENVSNVDTKSLCIAVFKGFWEDVAKYLQNAKPEDAIVIRTSVSGYLRAVLVGDKEFSKRSDEIADALIKLQDARDIPAVCGVLYKITKYFSRGHR